MTDQEILQLPMQENDSGADTIGGYFRALLSELFEREEGFSGKRPFGNSGWTYDLVNPLVKHGVITGSLDEYGHVEEYDEDGFNAKIFDLIESLGAAG